MPQSRENTLALKGQPIQPVTAANYLRGERYLRDVQGDFQNTRLKLKLGSLTGNHLLLLPPELSGVSTNLTDPNIRLTKIPGLEVGRQNSRAEVDFGQLYMGSEGDKSITEQVAAKYTHAIPAVREFFAGRTIDNRFGSKVTYTPLGFVKNEDGRVGSLTRYEHSVVSLDNILWNHDATSEQRLKAMAHAGLWLAQLHNLGIIHGDAQAKNIAYDSAGKPRFIDLEGASDINFGPLDTETKRLLDISNLFDPQTSKIPPNAEEIATFIDYYVEAQEGTYGRIDGLDVLDTIDSTQE